MSEANTEKKEENSGGGAQQIKYQTIRIMQKATRSKWYI